MDRDNTNRLSDFDYTRRCEWLETNGLGGYASGTLSGANTRRYHGLLIAALSPPVSRLALVTKLDETIVINGEEKYELGTNQYPGALYPRGGQYLVSFERDLFPGFQYRAGGVLLKKTIAAVHGENTTLILYEVLDAVDKFTLELLPMYATRDFNSVSHANDYISHHYVFDQGIFRTMNYQGCPEFFISVPRSTFTERMTWYYNVEYREDYERGMEFREDLYSHGWFSVKLKKGDRLGVMISTQDPSRRDAFRMFRSEKKRREGITKRFLWNDHLRRLALAADQFIVKRGDLNSIIAGYHWFTDWGRDAMISLPGLCLVTGRHKEAKNIIQAFADSVSEGLLPNRFTDNGSVAEYNTIDATLWFFQAVYKYYNYTGDKTFLRSLLPVLKDSIDWHYKGTRYNIHVDPADELLSGGQPGVQLTWMDAKAGDWVVTRRSGKAVEVNALWYNALCIMHHITTWLGYRGDADFYRMKSLEVMKSFNDVFWNEEQNCLYDYIDGDYKNDDLRPNQLYAISLPFPLLTKERAGHVLRLIEKHLLTPWGLRSLAPTHKDYKRTYDGDIWKRDGAYHQGTVWTYLLGPYIDALMFVTDGKAKAEASRILQKFFEHLDEACLGSASEIFDADPPHTPRGCIAHAWSVAEPLRVAIEHNLFSGMQKEEQSMVEERFEA